MIDTILNRIIVAFPHLFLMRVEAYSINSYRILSQPTMLYLNASKEICSLFLYKINFRLRILSYRLSMHISHEHKVQTEHCTLYRLYVGV
jgi:hypothetical protein